MKRVLVSTLVLLAACDPEQVVADVAEKTEEAADEEAKAAEAKAAAAEAEAKGAAVEACVQACDANTELSEDDRATCKLNCQPPSEPGGNAPGGEVVHRFTACIEGCASEANETDAQTCRLSCVGSGAVAFSKKGGGTSEGAKGCASACLTQILECQKPCDEGKASEDDKATCRLRCTTEGGECVDKCA